MTVENKVKIRLKKVHYLNGLKKAVGSVVRLPRKSAEWLIGRGSATRIEETKG